MLPVMAAAPGFIETVFAPVEGIPVLGLVLHTPGHYIAARRDSASLLMLDSRSPQVLEELTDELLHEILGARQDGGTTPAFKALKILNGKVKELDSKAAAFAAQGGRFDKTHTPGHWNGSVWVPQPVPDPKAVPQSEPSQGADTQQSCNSTTQRNRERDRDSDDSEDSAGPMHRKRHRGKICRVGEHLGFNGMRSSCEECQAPSQ